MKGRSDSIGMEGRSGSSNFQYSDQILDAIAEGLFCIDTKGICVSINKAGSKMLGYTSSFCSGKNMHDLIQYQRRNKELFPETESPIFKTLNSAEGCIVPDAIFWKADGLGLEVRYSANPLIVNGFNKGAVVTFNNNAEQMSREKVGPLQDGANQDGAKPDSTALDGANLEVTKQKEEQLHLKLLESAVTNTSDSVLISEADPVGDPGPRIIYVNEAFTRMTGYTSKEVIGKPVRMFLGPKSNQTELKRLRETLSKWQACEIDTIYYKKSGEEFWVNMSITPVFNVNGKPTHWINIERDITQRKNQELRNELLSKISSFFNGPLTLIETLEKALLEIVAFGDFSMAEAWLINSDKKKINQVAVFPKPTKSEDISDKNDRIKQFVKENAKHGTSKNKPEFKFWQEAEETDSFILNYAAHKADLKTAFGIPLQYNNEFIGIILFGSKRPVQSEIPVKTFFENFKIPGAEIRRKQLEEELNQIFNMAPDIICMAGTDGFFKKINPATCTLLGYSEEELLRRPFNDFIHPDDRVKTNSMIGKLTDGKPSLNFENRYITRKGKIKWLAWTTIQAVEQGLLYGVAKDITEKKDLEKLLNRSSELARIGGWEMDLIKQKIYWSAITKEIHEVEPDYQPDLEKGLTFFHGDTKERVIKQLNSSIAKGTPWDVETQLITNKGNQKWVRIIGEGEILNGTCVRIFGSMQDIDDRKMAEIAVNKAYNEKNTILESIGDAFFAVDKNRQITYWNNVAGSNFGKSADEILGQNIWVAFPNAIGTSFDTYLNKAFHENNSQHFESFSLEAKSWFEVSIYPSADGLSIYFRDIGERKTAENQMKELNESLQKQTIELAASNSELEQFAYVASHDLQEPLRMVTSFLTQLEKKYGDQIDDKGKQYINYAVDGAKRMRQIILDLLEFSRVGRSEEKYEEVDLNKIADEILVLYSKQIEETNAKISIDKLPTLISYKTPLRQVFQNLLSNSLKYHNLDAEPLIKITCKETKTSWRFAFHDNGIGIEAEYFDQIFIIFKRLHNKDEYSGTGMGLAVTKKIIENLGGKIWVDSIVGKGSTFYFTLIKKVKQ